MRRPAIFFDRDGVLNEDLGFVHKVADFRWMPGAKHAVQWLNQQGFLVFVVTNQSGIGRGYYEATDVESLHDWMQQELGEIDAHIDAFAYCPHHPEATVLKYRENCSCRKPKPGMIQGLLAAWPVDPKRSLLIGDQARDIEAAAAASLRGLRYQGGDLASFVQMALASQ